MKPVLEYLPRQSGESFVTRLFDYPFFPTPWHFHPEYELVLVIESTGRRYVGDRVTRFGPGDLALIGPYLPHTYHNDAAYHKNRSLLRAKSIVVHFKEDSFGDHFLDLPEMQPLRILFKQSLKGLAVTGKTNALVRRKMERLPEQTGFSRWLALMEILHLLAQSKHLHPISQTVVAGRNGRETDRMNKVIDFVLRNFKRNILLAEAAGVANMAKNSFSRYFSQRTRKSFIAFVNEVRLNYASKMLLESSGSIMDICLESGFNNPSNFNRQFRKLYGVSPLQFKKMYPTIA